MLELLYSQNRTAFYLVGKQKSYFQKDIILRLPNAKLHSQPHLIRPKCNLR